MNSSVRLCHLMMNYWYSIMKMIDYHIEVILIVQVLEERKKID
jgi:hypothetical protein